MILKSGIFLKNIHSIPWNEIAWNGISMNLNSLQDMKAVATVPSLYPVLVELNVVPSILGLLNHDNTDISVGVVDLLQVWLNLKSLFDITFSSRSSLM